MAERTKKKSFVMKGKYKDYIFYAVMIAWPILQFCVFYLGVNISGILQSFERIDALTGKITWTFDNIKNAFAEMTKDRLWHMMFANTFKFYAIGLVISMPLGWIFSFYIAKKFPFSGAFRILLYLPSIIASVVFVTMFRMFVDAVIPEMYSMFTGGKTMSGLLESTKTRFSTIMFFSIWSGFGGNVLLYSNNMSAISPDVIDSAHLDGATGIKEFRHITLPLIYPMITTFFITGFTAIFAAQYNLYTFYGDSANDNLATVGYYIYRRTKDAGSDVAAFPPIAAYNLLLAVITTPLVYVFRRALDKFGPSED